MAPRTLKPDCQHKRSDMTPCVIEDGVVAYAMTSSDTPICAGCVRTPAQTGVQVDPVKWAHTVAEYYRRQGGRR